METVIIGTFPAHARIDQLLRDLKEERMIPPSDISYIQRRTEEHTHEVRTELDDPVEGAASGAVIGGSLGAVVGLAAIAGILPGIGPILAAGPFAAMLGIGSAAVSTTAAGALTGAVAGGLVGGLSNLGASETDTQDYETRVRAGETLVIVNTPNADMLTETFQAHGATSVRTYPGIAGAEDEQGETPAIL
jgi:uncharacterized membrane protein